MVREKYLENEIFPGQGKVMDFYGWPGKGLGKSGNLKINGHGRQSSEICLFCSRGERMYILLR